MDYDSNYIKNLLPKRPKDSHKGTFGNVLNIAGSKFYTGAAYFSSIAALKVGCGKSILTSENNVLKSIASISPDVILMPNLKKIDFENFQAISIGCGLSTEKKACSIFKFTMDKLSKVNIPTIIDADGLNILSKSKNIKLPTNMILTPHPKEMSKLMGVDTDKILSEPEFWAKLCTEKYHCTTVLKTHKTIVTDTNNNVYINNTGNSALAHGGTGDVLCGMITGFLAQGLNYFDASVLAVYLHGLSAEIASEDLTEYSTLASDIVNYISKAIKKLSDN